MDAVKFGIIGAGDAANFHSLAFKQKPDAKVKYVAVYDINEKNANRLAKMAKLTPYTNFDTFMKHDMDAVLVTVPHYVHAEMVVKVAEGGKHVLCEKPMAPTLEECDKMITATKKAGVKFMIAENHRFLPALVKVKELIDKGFLGKVYLGRTYEGAFVPKKTFFDKDNWQFTYDKGGGGVLADQGVHKFGMLNYFLGEVESGEAFLGKALKSPPNKGEDNAVMFLHYKCGAMIEVIVSSTTIHPLNNTTELHGTNGHLLEDHSWEKPIKLFSNHEQAEPKGEYYDIAVEHGAYPKYYTIAAFHEDSHFAECIINNKEPEFTPQQAKEAVASVLLGYLSAKQGKRTTMAELKQVASTKGTKQILEGLEPFMQKNYETLQWT